MHWAAFRGIRPRPAPASIEVNLPGAWIWGRVERVSENSMRAVEIVIAMISRDEPDIQIVRVCDGHFIEGKRNDVCPSQKGVPHDLLGEGDWKSRRKISEGVREIRLVPPSITPKFIKGNGIRISATRL